MENFKISPSETMENFKISPSETIRFLPPKQWKSSVLTACIQIVLRQYDTRHFLEEKQQFHRWFLSSYKTVARRSFWILQCKYLFKTNRVFSKCSDLSIFATQCSKPLIFQTMNSVRSNNLSLKYSKCKPSGCKDIRIRKFEFCGKDTFFWF